MKYVTEYRDAEVAQEYARAIAKVTTKPWTLMEICGGQTHSIVKYGVDELLPKEITLVHVGFAISVIDEAEAKQVFEYLVQMGELGELETTGEPKGN